METLHLFCADWQSLNAIVTTVVEEKQLLTFACAALPMKM
jgi:hypothetical protein